MKLSKLMWLCVAGAIASLPISYSAASQEAQALDQSDAKAEAETVEEAGEAAGFSLSIKPRRKHYEVGAGIGLDVLFKDVNREKVRVSGQGIDLTYRLEIIRPDGTLAPLTERGERALKTARLTNSESGAIMNPGSEHGFTMGANGYFDMTQLGEYSLQVSRQVPSLEDPKQEVTLYSNVVKITIGGAKEAPKTEE